MILESAKKGRVYLISIQNNLLKVIFLIYCGFSSFFTLKQCHFILKIVMFQLQVIKLKIFFKKFSLSIFKKN